MYINTANFYDKLMSDVDYMGYAHYYDSIFKRFMKNKPHFVADLGCGTGELTIRLHSLGYDMTGVDISENMLSKAYEKGNKDILWLNQDICELDLYGTVDAAVSFLDCINHITEKDKLKDLFKKVNNFLNPGGVYIFDINTEYKFENVYGDNVFYSVSDDISYIWENDYDKNLKVCTMDITYFVNNEKGLYMRHDDTIIERAYSIKELKDIAKETGFVWMAEFDDKSMNEIRDDSERAFIILKKEGKDD